MELALKDYSNAENTAKLFINQYPSCETGYIKLMAIYFELRSYKLLKEKIQQLKTNIITLESSLKDLRAELKKQQGDYVKKEEQLKETIAELEKQQKLFERNERNFRETINDLESQKKDLFEQIEELKSSLNVLKSTSYSEETENMEEKESI